MHLRVILLSFLKLTALVISTPTLSQEGFSDLETILDMELQEEAEKNTDVLKNPMDYIELKRKRLADNMVTLSNTLDNILGGESADKESRNNSRIRITFGQLYEEYETPSEIFDLSAQIALPNTEKKFHLLLESFNQTNKEGSTTAVSNSSKLQGTPEERQYNAGLRFTPTSNKETHIGFDTGIRLVWPPQPFAKTRARHRIPLRDDFFLKLVQDVAWYNEEGWETHTQGAFEKALSRGKLFSFSNDLFWKDTQDYSEMTHTVSLFHPLSTEKYLTYWAGTLSELSRGLFIQTYEIGISFRQLIYKDWIYFQISPLGRWQRIHNFSFRSLLEAKFEFIIAE
ncbi:MAG: hypothetical protein KDD61_00915 [Bdellovibrionales bacterium]|nr:hypothetical protein [Bdellovibrionales bacterium]